MDINTALKEYGLSDKEIQIYIALLPLGSINLQEIAKKVSLPRTTIYNTLNYLAGKGLVSYIIKKGVRFYEASDPEKILDQINQKRELIKSVLPKLTALKDTTTDISSVEIYQGHKGVSAIIADVFKKNQQTYYFGSYILSKEILAHLPEHARTMRMENRIPAKIVMDYYDEPIFHTKDYKKITQMRFHQGLKEFPCMIFIYGNKVGLFTLKDDLIGIIIKNKQVAEAMKMVFAMYWDSSKQ